MKQKPIIKIENLTKRYGKFKALNDLSLKVEPGEVYGFLGPNGAGKTTTIKILLDIVKPTTGKVILFGQELNRSALDLKRKIGVVSEKQYIYKEMTAGEYLGFFGSHPTAVRSRLSNRYAATLIPGLMVAVIATFRT